MAKLAKVSKILERYDGATEVELLGSAYRAINYDKLTGEISEGDAVIVNTYAVELGLGTGSYHFVIWNLKYVKEEVLQEQTTTSAAGHIMKLRYTPYQTPVASIEDPQSTYRDIIENFKSLENMPVCICSLHSMVAGVAAGVKSVNKDLKIAYLMTDSAALLLSFSKLVVKLRRTGLLNTTITCGQAFGGELEAVNVYTALIVAKAISDVAIVGPGPGVVGTGTKYGNTAAIELGELINAVNVLGGSAIVVPRVSFADSRPRHYIISHHTLTALTEVALAPATICIPKLEDHEKQRAIAEKLNPLKNFANRYKIILEDGKPAIELLKDKNIEVETMGRQIGQDLEFFLAAGAAGRYAAKQAL